MSKRFVLMIYFGMITLVVNAQTKRPLSTYMISTKVSPECVSFISLTLFEEGSGQDSLNKILIEESLGNFMQSKPIRHLKYFYQNRQFVHRDSTFDFSIFSSLTFSKNDIYSFTICPQYACNKANDDNTFETQMVTMDAKTGKVLEMSDVFEPKMEDTLSLFVMRIMKLYRVRNLPVCKLSGINPNQIASSSGGSTTTDTITYLKGFTGKFYFSEGRIHLYNRVKHRDYDYTDVEVTLPMDKLKYFMRPQMALRLGL